MYEEPYRWIEAVGNRRQYLDDQFKQGSPIIAVSFADGILMLTVSRGTPKLYEIYDRIALGGMGHPADLEKVRFSLLDMAHLEGFNRSPSDVTGSRLLKYGIAPTIKQAFEEIFKAPYITKILLVELGLSKDRDQFLSIDYDGTFEETLHCAVLAGSGLSQSTVLSAIKAQIGEDPLSLQQALDIGVKAWAMGALVHLSTSSGQDQEEAGTTTTETMTPALQLEDEAILNHLRETILQHTLECCVLDRTLPGTSKYRALSVEEIRHLLPASLRSED